MQIPEVGNRIAQIARYDNGQHSETDASVSQLSAPLADNSVNETL